MRLPSRQPLFMSTRPGHDTVRSTLKGSCSQPRCPVDGVHVPIEQERRACTPALEVADDITAGRSKPVENRIRASPCEQRLPILDRGGWACASSEPGAQVRRVYQAMP
jgi:hypothetical protein